MRVPSLLLLAALGAACAEQEARTVTPHSAKTAPSNTASPDAAAPVALRTAVFALG